MFILFFSCAINKESDALKSKPHPAQIEENQKKQEKMDVDHPQSVNNILPSLVSRHPTPCSELDASTIDDFLYILEHIQKPPWTGMRAAQCILELYPQKVCHILRNG